MSRPDDSSMKNGPCIKICKFDAAGLCLGCYRTKAEVKNWKRMDRVERAAILARIAPAMEAANGGMAKPPKKLRKLDRKIAKLTIKMEKLRRKRQETLA